MGVANAIPGVSGGTIAFVTGIYERLINALKSFDITAIRMLCKLRFKEFSDEIQDTKEVKKVRRDIARIHTIRQERQMTQTQTAVQDGKAES